jgi:poly-D-alanine transfer protein DltD
MLKQNDIVRIKEDISEHFDYTPEMDDYQNQLVTVERANKDGEFYIKEDNGMWTWYEEMVAEIISK